MKSITNTRIVRSCRAINLNSLWSKRCQNWKLDPGHSENTLTSSFCLSAHTRQSRTTVRTKSKEVLNEANQKDVRKSLSPRRRRLDRCSLGSRPTGNQLQANQEGCERSYQDPESRYFGTYHHVSRCRAYRNSPPLAASMRGQERPIRFCTKVRDVKSSMIQFCTRYNANWNSTHNFSSFFLYFSILRLQ